MASSVAACISEQRLWSLLMDVAQYGATEKGGVNRQALSPEDVAARNHITRWATKHECETFQDEIGNLFVRYEGSEPDLSQVLTGSHLDSQPTGGKFDGAYGVIAGLEVLHAFKDAGLRPRRSIEVVAWTNEEGSRFSPGAMGSSIFAGVRDLGSVLDVVDRDGTVLRDALADVLDKTEVSRTPADRRKYHGYLEAHIEQGPQLENLGLPIGIVTGIQGIRRIDVNVIGDDAHAGTTPRASRKDALVAAMAVVSALRELAADEEDVLRFTVGRFVVQPGSPNTVPGRVHFSIDLRHPDGDVLRSTGDRMHEVAEIAAAPCAVEVVDISSVDPTHFPSGMVGVVRDAAARLGYSHVDMASGAGHDAMHVAKVCPAGMIFVPCLGGVSHNEAESATPEDLATGARVLAEAIAILADD